MRRPFASAAILGRNAFAALAALSTLLLAAPAARAALPDGSKAPDFSAEASLGGKTYSFSLADALKKGPVVLYFYPAAFTPGCTIEAHDFAKAMPQFKALGATVIGVSHDPIAKLQRFSVSECRKQFPVASDATGQIMKEYDAVLSGHPQYANRTSYVIAPDGKILYSYTNLNPAHHVANTMAVIKRWDQSHKKA
jgi:peroxiredoxin Q/BCP